MATSNNPLAPDPVTDIDSPEVHQHQVPIVNVDEGARKDINIELDEDDALFEKRGGVKDSHNRY